jgi:hypothetical protein
MVVDRDDHSERTKVTTSAWFAALRLPNAVAAAAPWPAWP